MAARVPVRRGTRATAGFTLVEAVVTLTVLALALGVVLASFGRGSAELRRIAGQLSGTIRAAYDNAALTGQTYRLVLDFAEPVIKVEATEASLSFDANQNPLQRGAALAQNDAAGGLMGLAALMSGGAGVGGAEANPEAADKDAEAEPPSPIAALLGLGKAVDTEEPVAFASTGHDLKLDDDIKLMDVWIDGMGDPIKEGRAYLYFYSNGTTQDAVINLTNVDGAVFSLRVHALTAETTVLPEYLEPPK